jgi:hypothetical protein
MAGCICLRGLGDVKRFSSLVALVATIAWAASADATIVVQDQWRDSTRSDPAPNANGYSESGADVDHDGDIESSWFNSPSANMTVVVPPAGGTGNAAATPGSTPNVLRVAVNGNGNTGNDSFETYFTTPGHPVTLANTGDFIKVTWQFVPTGIATSGTSMAFNFALANTNGTARLTSDSGSPASGDYRGYAMFTNMKTGNLGATNSFQLRERVNGSAAFLSSSSAWNALANGASTADGGYVEGQAYTYVMLLTLNSTGGLDITSTMSGLGLGQNNANQISVSFTDTTPSTLSYDMFGLRPTTAASTANVFDTTLFQVDTNTAVPEATSFLLVGLIGGFGLALQRFWGRKKRPAVASA